MSSFIGGSGNINLRDIYCDHNVMEEITKWRITETDRDIREYFPRTLLMGDSGISPKTIRGLRENDIMVDEDIIPHLGYDD